MANPAAIEINGRVEPTEGGFHVRIVVGCNGLRVEEVGPTHATESAAEEQLSEVMGDIALRVYPVGEGIHA